MVEVVAAVIFYREKILCFKRGNHKFEYIGNKFEFPGGKIDQNEKQKEALKREIKEELNYEIEIHEKIMTIDHEYPDFKLKMHCYKCTANSLDFVLGEHTEYRLLDKSELQNLEWVPADIEIVDYLIKN
tara:strand:+ start:147 stop:533 length:387 start_codon:yes stop_codon:yes gene_type:complete